MQEFCGEKGSRETARNSQNFHTIKPTHQLKHQRAVYQAMQTHQTNKARTHKGKVRWKIE
jgi:hypothetical protein